jgi:hypothetical protein
MKGPAKCAAVVSVAVFLAALLLGSAEAAGIDADPISRDESRPAALGFASGSASIMSFPITDVAENDTGGVRLSMSHERLLYPTAFEACDPGGASMRMVHARWDRFSHAASLFPMSDEAPFEYAALAIADAVQWGLSLTPVVFGLDTPYCNPWSPLYRTSGAVLTLHFIPEPSPAALVSIGLLGLTALGRRRKGLAVGGIRLGGAAR